MNTPVWVSSWHAPLLKLTRAAVHANRDKALDPPRLVGGLFAPLKDQLNSISIGPVAFKIMLTFVANYFVRASRGEVL